ASVSVGDIRTSSAPCVTGVPRSIGAETTRPAVSAATSACSSAISVPVPRMKPAIGCSVAATAATSTTTGALGRSFPLASPDQQRAHGDERIERLGQLAGVDAGLKLLDDLQLAFACEREALVLPADARNRLVEKHQREILRVVAAELVEAPEDGAHALDLRGAGKCRIVRDRRRVAEQLKAFFGEREEDVVLAREVAVDRGRAVLNPLCN